MLLGMEKQHQICNQSNDQVPIILATSIQRMPQKIFDKPGQGKRVDRRTAFCTHCKRNGHDKETCFKLNGLSDLYKDVLEHRRREGIIDNKYSYSNSGSTMNVIEDNSTGSSTNGPDLNKYIEDMEKQVDYIKQEVAKMENGGHDDTPIEQLNFFEVECRY